jgi:ABC-2 type transport system ATP-binding protein
VIHARSLGKDFLSFKKQPGLLGSIRSFWRPEPLVKAAVKGFNLEVKRGEIVGLLGPNGAGKTTLMKMLSGIVVPSRGELEVMGFRPQDRSEAFRARIALVMGQKSQLWWDIPAQDSFELLRSYYEISDQDFTSRLGELAHLLEVEKLLHVHLRRLSLGERMKMELIACLLHRPEVLYLDEPTIGLDLVAQHSVRSFLKEWQREHETTILLTSHYMADVAALCQRIVLILEGEKRYDGTLGDFEHLLGHDRVVFFRFSEVPGKHPLLTPHDPRVSEEGHRVELRVPEEELRKVAASILSELPVVDFASEEMPIERVMKELLSNPELVNGDPEA